MAGQNNVVVIIAAQDNSGVVMKQLEENLLRVNERARQAGESIGSGMQHAVPEIAAASGAIREFEGNLPIRAVERFLTTTLGLGPVLAAAFPLVGAIAFAGVLVEGFKKIVAMKEEADKLGKAIHDDFQHMGDAAKLANDAMAIVNDRLQETLDKLQHKPESGMASALDEAKESADRLATSLSEDLKKMDELMKKNEVGFFGKMLGKAGNDKDAAVITGFNARVDSTSRSFQGDIDAAASRGEKGNVDKLRVDQAVALQGIYAEAVAKVRDTLQEALAIQDKFVESKGLFGSDQTARIEQARGALQAWEQQQERIGGSMRNTNLREAIAPLETSKRNAEAAGKLEAARRAQDDAVRKAAEQAAQSLLAGAKASGDLEVARLEDQHKRQLISDRDYYAQRAEIQKRALDAESAAVMVKQGAVAEQIRGVLVDRGKHLSDPVAVTKDDTKVIELQTQINALEDQRLKIVQERRKIGVQSGTEDFASLKAQRDVALDLAAEVEATRGGSTEARLARSRAAYNDRRSKLILNNATPDELSDADALQRLDEDRIGVQGVELKSSVALGGIGSRRSAVDDSVRRGTMSNADAQRERIALSRQEAEALQPVLDAYSRLAGDGDLSAKLKVQELSTRITELKNPIDEVAAHIREQLDSAFEGLFTHLDEGKKGWEAFGKQIQRIFISEAYRSAIEPSVQGALGKVFKNGSNGIPFKSPSVVAAALSEVPGVGKLPGLSGVTGGGSSAGVNVTLINQGTPAAVVSTSQQQDQDGEFSARTITAVLKDLEQGGSIFQALGMGGGG